MLPQKKVDSDIVRFPKLDYLSDIGGQCNVDLIYNGAYFQIVIGISEAMFCLCPS